MKNNYVKIKKLNSQENFIVEILKNFYDQLISLFNDEYDPEIVDVKKRSAELKDHKGYFKAIASHAYVINNLALIIKKMKLDKVNKINFIDVGCGKGNIMYLIKTLCNSFKVDNKISGLDIIRRKIFYNSTFIVSDALQFNSYQDYNLIYLYNPISDNEKMIKLLDKITNDAKEGTFIYFVNACLGESDLKKIFPVSKFEQFVIKENNFNRHLPFYRKK